MLASVNQGPMLTAEPGSMYEYDHVTGLAAGFSGVSLNPNGQSQYPNVHSTSLPYGQPIGHNVLPSPPGAYTHHRPSTGSMPIQTAQSSYCAPGCQCPYSPYVRRGVPPSWTHPR